jgi:hypothetical protein
MFLKIWQEAAILPQRRSNGNGKFWLTGILARGIDCIRVMAKHTSVTNGSHHGGHQSVFCYHCAAFAGSQWIALN